MRFLRHSLFAIVLAGSPLAIAGESAAPLTHEQALEQVHRLLVPSPYKLSELARVGRIRYTLEITDGQPWAWPMTGEQSVRDVDGKTVVTVCADCGSEPLPDAVTLSRYLAPNRWVDSDARTIVDFARANAHGRNVEGQMLGLVAAVQRRMTGPIDFRRYDAASVALRTRSGDCTEFAVLLAAAARARGIPTRLAYGVTYSSRFTGQSHVFGPHVWVQSWDGKRWASYDAGVGRFDAGHIALFIGDGSVDGQAEVARAIEHLRIVDAVGVKLESDAALSGAASGR